MNNPDELAGLPERVREDMDAVTAAFVFSAESEGAVAWRKCRAELLRLARENAEWRKSCDREFDRAGVWSQRAERAEAELAAMKRRIAEAPVMRIDPVGDGAYWSMADGTSINELNELIGQRVALLPVGGDRER